MKMKRQPPLSLLLILALLAMSAAQAPGKPAPAFAGDWYQTNDKGDAWQLTLNPDGTGTMRNGSRKYSSPGR